MYIPNIGSPIKRMTVNEVNDFIFENYYKQIRFPKRKQLLFRETFEKKICYYLQKLIEKMLDPTNANQYYLKRKTQNY